jgi:hypothetical protein
MGAYKNLPYFLGKDLVSIAREMDYSQSNILILEGNIHALKEQYPDVYSALITCTHNRDARTPLEYAQDLVASWLFEDYICDILNENGLETSKAGADKERVILSSKKVSASSDTTITFGGHSRLVEIMTDYGGYWARNKVIDLRDSKFNELCKTKSIFLGFSTTDKKFILIDCSKPVEARFIRSHFPYGGKPAYQIGCSGLMQVYSPEKLVNSLKKMM